MNTFPAHHTPEHWAQRPRRMEDFVVAHIDDLGDSVSLRSTRSYGFCRSKSDLGREVRVGERLQLETIGFSMVTGLRDEHGWLFRMTNLELAADARKFSEDMHRKDVERLEAHRKQWAQWEADLPQWLQARILRFREAAGEKFLLSGWGYELVICRLADMFDRGLEVDAEKFSDEEGASGNQWDCAKALAAGRKEAWR